MRTFAIVILCSFFLGSPLSAERPTMTFSAVKRPSLSKLAASVNASTPTQEVRVEFPRREFSIPSQPLVQQIRNGRLYVFAPPAPGQKCRWVDMGPVQRISVSGQSFYQPAQR